MSHEFSDTPIVGVTGTFYQDKNDPRFELSLATTEAWRDQGLPLVIVDGSPLQQDNDDWVAAAYRSRGANVLRSEINGIATQRQQGIAHAIAGDGKAFLTHEPEKTLMPNFAHAIAGMLESNDVVVVGRTQVAENSLPPVQRRTEHLAGWILQETLDLPADALAGPRGYSKAGAQHLLNYPALKPGMNNWIYMYDTPLEARANGQSVAGLQVDLIHPATMVAQETDNPVFDRKRYNQFRLQLEYLLNRPEVRPEALSIAHVVLDGLETLPENPTNQDYEAYFSHLEAVFAGDGYVKPRA